MRRDIMSLPLPNIAKAQSAAEAEPEAGIAALHAAGASSISLPFISVTRR
jgi:hypothetical protein